MKKRILVTGAGGFIGFHLVRRLKRDGHWVRGADIKMPEFDSTTADEFLQADLREFDNCLKATEGVDEIYNLAADMGGIGYITASLADIARNNVLINVHMLEAARRNETSRFLYTSSACIYPRFMQETPDVAGLKETDAYPADPEPGYGWEKLYSEEMCKYYHQDHGLDTRVVRFHNVYGPVGTYDGGKEKVPAAICRKVALATDSIDIWGDGEQTRSFMHVDDCVEGLIRLMASSHRDPINLGTEEMVTINELVDLVCEIADKPLSKEHDTSKPQGVRGRNSDNTLLRDVLGWEPQIMLREGIVPTYHWIREQLQSNGRIA